MLKEKRKKQILITKKIKRFMIILFFVFTLSIMSVAYAAYMRVVNIAFVSKIYNPEKEEVVIKSVTNTYGCGFEMVDVTNTEDSITFDVEIPDLECSMFYEVEIVNNFDVPMKLVDIVEQYNDNENIMIVPLGFEKDYFILAHETITMMIEIKYISSLSEKPENIGYNDIIVFNWETLDIMEIVARITYSKVSWTNKSVIAKISFNQKDITITNNNDSDQFVFEDNGEFIFEYKNSYDVVGSIRASVSWIDKEME